MQRLDCSSADAGATRKAPRVNPSDGPHYVYHYTTSSALLPIAFDGGLHLGRLSEMNDPRESRDWEGISSRPILFEKLDEEIRRFKERIRIASFSAGAQDETETTKTSVHGYGKPTIWAHYADRHRGVCLAFDRHLVEAGLRRGLKETLDESGGLLRSRFVRYVENASDDVAYDSVQIPEGSELSDAVTSHYLRHFEDLFFTKHLDWRAENEWRWVIYDPADSAPRCIDMVGALVGVFLGADFDPSQFPSVRELIEALGADDVTMGKLAWDRLVPNLDHVHDIEGRLVIEPSMRARWGISARGTKPEDGRG